MSWSLCDEYRWRPGVLAAVTATDASVTLVDSVVPTGDADATVGDEGGDAAPAAAAGTGLR